MVIVNEEQYNAFATLIKEAFSEMQNLVETSSENNKYVFSQFEFPQLTSFHDNGMPRLSTYFSSYGPKNYSSLFQYDDEHHYYYKKLPVFQKIIDFFSTQKSFFKKHPYFRDIEERESLYQILLESSILIAFDCYMQEAKSDQFNEAAFNDILFRLFNRFFLHTLPLNICVPILLTRFDSDEYAIADGIRIRKMTDLEIISSYKQGGYSDTIELFIVSSATHILELQNYTLENTPLFNPIEWENEDTFPPSVIDKWFAAYRIITHNDTGYGQVLLFPINWGVRRGNLIDIDGIKNPKYPKSLKKKNLN